MRAWKAEMETNMTVFIKVERTCSPITVSIYQLRSNASLGLGLCRTIGSRCARPIDRYDLPHGLMYVPPMAGSAMRAWKAEMETNMTVFIKVERTCSPINASLGLGLCRTIGSRCARPIDRYDLPHGLGSANVDLKGEVNQHDQGHVVLAKALVQELETGDSVIGLES
jgi:hypothetical protein